MIYVDTDCALGSSRGDVDDGFALAALLKSEVQVDAIGSVFGNADSTEVWSNTRELARRCGYDGPVLMGAPRPEATSEASQWLAHSRERLRVLAIGPLTNIAAALPQAKIDELIVVGGNTSSSGRWPPVWPFEFNLTKDVDATWNVFNSSVPITVVPLDVARRLRARPEWLSRLRGGVGEYLREHSLRWQNRIFWWIRGGHAFPVWDLVAAVYVIYPPLFETRRAACTIHRNGWIDFSGGPRVVNVVEDYDPKVVWDRFEQLLTQTETNK